MDQEQFINELFELGEAARRLAATLPDPAISFRLEEIAYEIAALAHAESRFIGIPRSDPPIC